KLLEIPMPQFAESVVEATIGKWLKNPGELIDEYEPICEIISEKVTAELPSTVSGKLHEIYVAEGATVSVGSIICTVEVEDDGATAPVASSNGVDTVGGVTAERSKRPQQTVAVASDADAP